MAHYTWGYLVCGFIDGIVLKEGYNPGKWITSRRLLKGCYPARKVACLSPSLSLSLVFW
jgi:hypothetical protein